MVVGQPVGGRTRQVYDQGRNERRNVCEHNVDRSVKPEVVICKISVVNSKKLQKAFYEQCTHAAICHMGEVSLGDSLLSIAAGTTYAVEEVFEVRERQQG